MGPLGVSALGMHIQFCHEIFGAGTGNGLAGPGNASYLVPPHHMWSYPAHAF